MSLERVETPILRSLKPVARLSPPRVYILLFALTFLGLTALGAHREGMNSWQTLSALQKVWIFTSLAVSAALLSFSSVLQMIPGSKQRFTPTLVPLGASALILLATSSVDHYQRDHHLVRDGIDCMFVGIAYAIPAAILFSLILRRGAVLNARVTGANAGMLAGLVGTGILEALR